MYVIVGGEGVTETTLQEVRLANPEVSFPKVIPEELLAQYNVYPISEGTQPAFNPDTHKVVITGLAMINGVWTRQYEAQPLTPEDLTDKVKVALDSLAEARFAVETGGYVWTDSSGESWWFSTTLEAQGKIEANRRTAESGIRPENGVWKCGHVVGQDVIVEFRPTTNAEIQDIGMHVHAFVQKCYTAEGNAVAKVRAGDLSADFATEFSAL